MSGPQPGCAGHAGMSDELRAFAIAALDRLEPVLDRLRIEPPTTSSEGCTACPVCALAAALRGERPELVQRLAEQVGGFVSVLRDALAEQPSSEQPPAERTASGSPRQVQRIPVERVEAGR